MPDLVSNLPLELLRAELLKRQNGSTKPACGSTGVRGEYNVGIHVFALFLILILSTVACAFPIIARRFPNLPIPHCFLFLSRHFGTGVLIATAFVHLLPTAFVSMTDPCLPSFWNERYKPMAGLIAMLSVFAVVTVEMIFASRGAGHSHHSDFTSIPDDKPRRLQLEDDHEGGRVPLHSMTTPEAPQEAFANGSAKPERKRAAEDDSDADLDDLDDLDNLDPLADESAHLSDPTAFKRHARNADHEDDDNIMTPASTNPQKQFLQCLLLEAGILFHSIFIGMAVSVATGTSFVVLLVAISFHQTFEGFALGSRIAGLIPNLFEPSSPKPWLMALAYGTTTPIGQVIGLILAESYDPQSESGLLMVGITNAVSSGLLLFAGLVQLVAEDFLSDRSYEVLRGRRRIEACLSVFLGGLLMSFVGAFA